MSGYKLIRAKFHIEEVDGVETKVYEFGDFGAHLMEVIDNRTLEEACAEASERVLDQYNKAWVSPVPYNGDFIQVNKDSREDLAAYKAVASDAISGLVEWPTDFAWRMLSNNMLPLPTPQDMIKLAMAPVIRNTELFKRSLVAKAAIAAILASGGTNEEADNINF